MLLILAFLIGALSLSYYWIQQRYSYWTRRGIVQEEPRIPTGNVHEWRITKQFGEIFKEIYFKYKGQGPYVGFYFLFSKAVVVLDVDLLKNIFIKDFNKFDERGSYHNANDDPLSAHLFAVDGDKWRTLRHKMTPTFTSGKMKFMYPTVLKVGEELVRVFGEKAGKDGKTLEIGDIVSRFTADVIGTCAFGLECNSLTNADAEFVRMGRRAISKRRHGRYMDMFTFTFPELARKLHIKITLQDVEDFYLRIVRETFDYRVKNNIKRNDFMDMLIEMKKQNDQGKEGINFEELAAQAFVFFLAGFETSSTTMGFALYELAKNQDVQDRLRAEINETLANHDNKFTYECMKEMKYLDQVIDETLRMYPIVSHLLRKTRDHFVPDDPKYYLEPGTTVFIPVMGIHYDPDIYPEPEKFLPERFTEEAIKSRPACTWLPFGDGPRNCIGLRFGKMQTCIGLGYLVKNFKFTVVQETEMPLQFDKANILLNAKNGIRLGVTPL